MAATDSKSAVRVDGAPTLSAVGQSQGAAADVDGRISLHTGTCHQVRGVAGVHATTVGHSNVGGRAGLINVECTHGLDALGTCSRGIDVQRTALYVDIARVLVLMVSGFASDVIIVLKIALDTVITGTDGHVAAVHDKIFVARDTISGR